MLTAVVTSSGSTVHVTLVEGRLGLRGGCVAGGLRERHRDPARTHMGDVDGEHGAPYRPSRMKTTKPISASASVKAMPRNIVVRTMPAASG